MTANKWAFTPSNSNDITCTGNIETLLDAETVVAGQHPTMAAMCF